MKLTIKQLAKSKCISSETYNTNNGWGFGGIAGKQYNLPDGTTLIIGQLCYRHLKPESINKLILNDECGSYTTNKRYITEHLNKL